MNVSCFAYVVFIILFCLDKFRGINFVLSYLWEIRNKRSGKVYFSVPTFGAFLFLVWCNSLAFFLSQLHSGKFEQTEITRWHVNVQGKLEKEPKRVHPSPVKETSGREIGQETWIMHTRVMSQTANKVCDKFLFYNCSSYPPTNMFLSFSFNICLFFDRNRKILKFI